MDAAGRGRPPLPPDLGGKGSKKVHGGSSLKGNGKSARETTPRPGSIEAIVALTASNKKVEGSNVEGLHYLDSQVRALKAHNAASSEGQAADLDGLEANSPLRKASIDAMDEGIDGCSESGSTDETDDSSSDGDSMAIEPRSAAPIEGMIISASLQKFENNCGLKLMCNEANKEMSSAANTMRIGASMEVNMKDMEDDNCCTPGARGNVSTVQNSEIQHSQGVRQEDSCKIGTATNETLSRKWSDIAGQNIHTSRENISIIPIPPSKAENAFNSVNNTVRLCDESRESQLDRFDAALVGRLFGRRLPYQFLRDELYKRWEKFGSFRMITAGPDCFMCLFDEAMARDRVLSGGPWIVAGQVIGIDKWSRDFSPTSKVGFITPVWVRLPGLPFDCWEMQNMARILEAIGTPLWTDVATAQLDRGSFARACVKIDLAKPLSAGLWIEDKVSKIYQPILYEGLSMFCCKCGYVGHKETVCPDDIKTASPPATLINNLNSGVDVSTSLHQILKAGGSLNQDETTLPRGDWMIVGRRRRVGSKIGEVRSDYVVEKSKSANRNSNLQKNSEFSNSFGKLQDVLVLDGDQLKAGGSGLSAGRSSSIPTVAVRVGEVMHSSPIEGQSNPAHQNFVVRPGGCKENSPRRAVNAQMIHGYSSHADSDTDLGVARSPRAVTNSPRKHAHLKANGNYEENFEDNANGSTYAMEKAKSKAKWVPNAATPPFIRNADFYKTPTMNLITASSGLPGGKFKKKRVRDRFSPSTISILANDIKNSFYKEGAAGSGGDKCYSGTDEKAKGNRKNNKSKASGDSSSLVKG